jgi:hypothetical protein
MKNYNSSIFEFDSSQLFKIDIKIEGLYLIIIVSNHLFDQVNQVTIVKELYDY